MFKRLSFLQFYLLMAAVIFIILTIGLRFPHVMMMKSDVLGAAYDLITEQNKAGKEIEVNDAKIIVSKIFPKSTFQYTINPFVWTRKQMSANDDLLQACLDAKEREDIKDALEYKEAAKTFDSRFSEWEMNLEKAKESLK